MFLSLILLQACFLVSPDDWEAANDRDGDGVLGPAAGGLDCDDDDPLAYPGAPERCNEADDDCDGEVDEDPVDAPAWHPDQDGDGWGDASSSEVACEAPEGRVQDATDCDDTDAAVNPAATEICNAVDDDCDGETLEPPTWYLDADADGYGDPDAPQSSCEAPSGFVEDATDCDDTDPEAHPGGQEVCNLEDDDCDDRVDEDAVDAPTWYVDADTDGYGNLAVSSVACYAPGGYVGSATDCDDGDPYVHPLTPELCDGVDNDCDAQVDEPDAADASTWYLDGDGDGWGQDALATVACLAPSGSVALGGDCDDTAASTWPGAPETCDGVDQDCDGTADDGATDAPTWYADTDGDGWGDPGAPRSACEAPPGFVLDATDCNDTAAATNPSAPEVCNLSDDDCDGLTDESDAADASTWYADTDADGWGNPLLSLRACYGPVGYVSLLSDCDDGADAVHPMATEVCNGVDDNCDGSTDGPDAADASSWYADADGDGWGASASVTLACGAPEGAVPEGGDCDDGDDGAFPGAPEICDGRDDDCDGGVDLGAVDASTWYADGDGDGWGDATRPTTACEAPAFHVGDGTDCDDHQDDTWPGAPETCNGADDDCDGTTDEPEAVDASTWYADTDGDGWGDPLVTAVSCAAPSGHVAMGTDCDDAHALAHPGGTEVCNGLDDDCDGVVDGGEMEGAPTVYADADGDGYGDPAVSTNACGTLSGYVSDATDCDDSLATAHPGATEKCGDHIDQNCDPTDCAFEAESSLGTAGVRYTGEHSQDYAGSALGGGGDVNGDGYDDFLVGASGVTSSSGYRNSGAAYLVLGRKSPVGYSLTYAQSMFSYATESEGAGYSVAIAGDVDGDGLDDMLIGAPNSDATGYESGAAYLVYGSASPADLSLADAIRFAGDSSNESAGAALSAAGDVDGDGLDDFLVGAPDRTSYGFWVGAAYLLLGGDLEGGTLGTVGITLVKEGSDHATGEDVAGLGDVDGDGFDDMLVGAPWAYGYVGAAYLLLGKDPAMDLSLESPDAIFVGESGGAGTALAGAGDVNGDGYRDALVGAPNASSVVLYAGAAYLVLGAPGFGDLELSDADARWDGEYRDEAGYSLAGPGDVDADGFDDIVIGSCEIDGTDYGRGLAWLIRGSATPSGGSLADASATFVGEATGDAAGWDVAAAGDVDADGFADFLVGAPGVSFYYPDYGAAYLILGDGQ